VQIDSTPIERDGAAGVGDAGAGGPDDRGHVATRTICAAVLRPVGTNAVDAALLLARM
jgi:putative transposase